MLHLRVVSPAHLTDEVTAVLSDDRAISSLVVVPGVAVRPVGDMVLAEVAREGATDVVDRLRTLGVPREGSIHLEPVGTWLSQAGYDAERRTPGSGADAVVWAEVGQRAYDDTEINWTFTSFMTMATMIAGIAIILDSQILVIGAMVLGPEFGAIAALGVALVRHRYALLGRALRALAAGFACGILATMAMGYTAMALGWIDKQDITSARPGTEFIYQPDRWTVVVAVIAAAAGVLSLTSARVGGLAGVFISVTTIPAAGNIALGLAVGASDEVRGSATQLVLNVGAMAVAGWLTLLVQQTVWARMSARRERLVVRRMKRRAG